MSREQTSGSYDDKLHHFKEIHSTSVQTSEVETEPGFYYRQKYCLLITNDYTSLLLFIHYLQCVVIFYRHGNGVKINAEL